jgi:Arc/MetJ-type ribon-helix-helix transcriptional regulator
MAQASKTIELPEDLQAFAEERVRTGQNTSVAEVVRDAFGALQLGTSEARDLDADWSKAWAVEIDRRLMEEPDASFGPDDERESVQADLLSAYR